MLLLCIHCRHEHVVEISADTETLQDISGVLGLAQAPMEDLAARIISMDGQPVTSNFQIVVG